MRTLYSRMYVLVALVALCALTALAAEPEGPLACESPGAPVERRLAAGIPAGYFPGYAVALVDEGGVLWSKGFGFASLGEHRRVTPNTSFWLASISKAILGTAIVRAEEQGALPLQLDVRALVANRAGFQIAAPNGAPIRLQQLVTHTSVVRDAPPYACSYYVGSEDGERSSLLSGYRELFDPEGTLADLVCDDQSPADLGGYLRSYLSADGRYYTPDNFGETDPGAAPVYSNVGAALAGYAFELGTGRSVADYAAAQFFRPLRMRNTSWRLSDLPPHNIATPYAWDAREERHVPLPYYSLSTWPDGGVRSSANDLGRFLAMVIHDGELNGTRVLKRTSVRRMLSPLVGSRDDGTGVFWGLGQLASGVHLIGHSGGDPGATTHMYFDPAARVGFVLLINSDRPDTAGVVNAAFIQDLLREAARLHAQH